MTLVDPSDEIDATGNHKDADRAPEVSIVKTVCGLWGGGLDGDIQKRTRIYGWNVLLPSVGNGLMVVAAPERGILCNVSVLSSVCFGANFRGPWMWENGEKEKRGGGPTDRRVKRRPKSSFGRDRSSSWKCSGLRPKVSIDG